MSSVGERVRLLLTPNVFLEKSIKELKGLREKYNTDAGLVGAYDRMIGVRREALHKFRFALRRRPVRA